MRLPGLRELGQRWFSVTPPCACGLLLIGLTLASVQRSGAEGPPLPPGALLRIPSQPYVYSVGFLPDGKTLAWGDADQTIRLWATDTGKNIGTLKGHTKQVCSVAFSPNGRTLASGSLDKTIRLWDVASGKELRTLMGHHDSVRCVAFSPDGKTLASGSDDRTIRFWEAATGKAIRSLAGPDEAVEGVAFSPDGKALASVGGVTTRLWDVGLGKEIHQWTRVTLTRGDTPSLVHAVAFSPDGKLLASGIGSFVRVWEVATGKAITTLTGHEGLVVINSVAFSPDCKTLASGSGPSSFMDSGEEKCIRLWDLTTGRELGAWGGHPDGTHSLAFSPDGKTLAAGGDKGVLIWRTAAAKKRGR